MTGREVGFSRTISSGTRSIPMAPRRGSSGTAHASPGATVKALEWFPLDRLPPTEEVGHGGWALETLKSVRARGH
jgi:hypothetical protein